MKILRLVRGLGDLQEQLKAAVLARQLLAFVRGNGLCLQARGTLLFDFARQASDRFIIIPSRHFRPVLGMRTKLPPLFFKHKAYQSRPALSGPMLLKAMNNEPDHPEDREFAHQAASASLAMPIIAILLSAVWRTNTLGGSKAVLGLACMGCIVLGMIFSIIALCNVTGSDSGGLVRRGLIGFLFNGIFVAIFGFGFMSGFSHSVKARQAHRDLLRATQTLRENSRKSFSDENGLTNMHTADVKRVREELEKAGSTFKGQDALLAKTWAAYLRQVELASQKWQTMYNELAAAKVLDFSELNGKQELRSRQDLVHRYQASSDAMRELVVNSSDFFRSELTRLGATAGNTEQAVERLEAQSAVQRRLLLQIRDLDTRMVQDMLAVLSLLETHWGSWSCPSGPVVFNDRSTLQQYNTLLADLRTAGQEQVAAQRKLVGAQ